jgi:hypothetical protein
LLLYLALDRRPRQGTAKATFHQAMVDPDNHCLAVALNASGRRAATTIIDGAGCSKARYFGKRSYWPGKWLALKNC